MQRITVPYNPALDDGGGALGAEPQRYIPGEMGDAIYTDHFEPDNEFVRDLPCWEPPELYMPSGNPVPVPLDTQAPESLTDSAPYYYIRSHSSSLTQPNFPGRIHPSNDFHSQSTSVAVQSHNMPNLSIYHHDIPVVPTLPIGHASGVGSNGDSIRPHLTFTGYDSGNTSIPPPQGEYFDVIDKRLLEGAQFYLAPPQNDVGDPEARNTYDLAASQGLWTHVSPHQPIPRPLTTALSLNAPMPTYLNMQANDTRFVLGHPAKPQAINVCFTPAPPEWQAHCASPPYPRTDHPPPPFTEGSFFNASQLSSPPNYPESSPPHQEVFGNRAPGGIFGPVGVGNTYQREYLHGHAEQSPPPISEVSLSPLASLHHNPAIWPRRVPHQQNDPSGSGLLIASSLQNDSSPQSLSSSPEVFGYTGQASDGGSSLSPTTMIHTDPRIPATDPHTPDYGGLNTFLSQRDSLSRVQKRSMLCRPPVLKHDDCPPNLRSYLHTDIPIPPRECDTMYKTYGAKVICIKCGYDATPPRRPGLKYEHVSAHINNRPYYCLHCHRGFFRKSNHRKTHHPLWRPMPPSPS